MIWHFLEVWLLVVVSFALGCVLGAVLYRGLSDSPLALAQGGLADLVGDGLDWAKIRLGVGPAWRPELSRSLIRAAPLPMLERIEPPAFDEPSVALDPEHEASYVAIALADHEPPEIERGDFDDDIPVEDVEFVEEDFGDDDFATPLAAIPAPRPPVAALPPPEPARAPIIPMRPAGLSKPRGGVPDNLTRIRGIGQRNEGVLNSLGIFHFSQIAAWTPGEVLWIGRYLAFPERIERDDWVSQAMVLATGGETGFEKSAERRRKRRAEARMRGALADGDTVGDDAEPSSDGVGDGEEPYDDDED